MFTYRVNDGLHAANLATVTLTPIQSKAFLPVINR